MLKMLPALPMLSIDPALPMLRIEPALPTDKIEPTLPMLKTLPTLRMLPTLPKLNTLNKLLALSGPAKLPVLMGARPRLHLERMGLPISDSSVLGTSSPIYPAAESLAARPTGSSRRSHTDARLPPAPPVQLRATTNDGPVRVNLQAKNPRLGEGLASAACTIMATKGHTGKSGQRRLRGARAGSQVRDRHISERRRPLLYRLCARPTKLRGPGHDIRVSNGPASRGHPGGPRFQAPGGRTA